MQVKRDGFSSRFGVIAAAAGSAIGLGNIWRFPYVLGENGGGAFFLLYLLFVVIIGIPLMFTELSLGRAARRNIFGAFRVLAPGTKWYAVGLMGVAAAFMILSFYSAVAGWTLEYTFLSVKNGFQGKSPEELNIMFDTFVSNPFKPVLWMLLFLVLTGGIVLSGIEKGIEKYTKILMPLLLVIVLILAIRAITLKGAEEGLRFLFMPDFSKINANTILEALGQAFFSLSLGMGVIMTYGSYIKKEGKMLGTATSVTLVDTLIAVLAGVAIFPAVFAFGIEPNAGAGLVFKTLPNIFIQMNGGYVFALMFFSLLVIAALTSSISDLEVVVAYFTEEMNMSRRRATWITLSVISFLGIFCSLSFGELSGFKIFGFTVFDSLDKLSSNILLPLGGLCISLFAGWYLGKKVLKEKIFSELSDNKLFAGIAFVLKFLAPVAIAFVFLNGLGVIN